MKVEFIKYQEEDCTIGISIKIDGNPFCTFFNEWACSQPEDLKLYRDMSFLLELPELFKKIKDSEKLEIVITEELE